MNGSVRAYRVTCVSFEMIVTATSRGAATWAVVKDDAEVCDVAPGDVLRYERPRTKRAPKFDALAQRETPSDRMCRYLGFRWTHERHAESDHLLRWSPDEGWAANPYRETEGRDTEKENHP